MKLGLQISSFTWSGGDAAIADTFAGIVRAADDAGRQHEMAITCTELRVLLKNTNAL